MTEPAGDFALNDDEPSEGDPAGNRDLAPDRGFGQDGGSDGFVAGGRTGLETEPRRGNGPGPDRGLGVDRGSGSDRGSIGSDRGFGSDGGLSPDRGLGVDRGSGSDGGLRAHPQPGGTSPRRAVVLGSGGVLGFAWMVGALAAFEAEAQTDVRSSDLLVGTSAGSVGAALLSCGVSVDQIRRHHQGVPAPTDPPIAFDYDLDTGGALPSRPQLRPGSPRLLFDAVRHPRQSRAVVALAGALPAGRGTLDPVRRLIVGLTNSTALGDNWPGSPHAWIVATDYRTGRRVVFGRDAEASLPDAVVASCAIPAWYPPVVIEGRSYIDGGAVSNASIDLVADADVDEVYVFAPMASVERDRPLSPASRIERAVRRAITRGIIADIESLRAQDKRVIFVTPGPEDLAVIGANLMNPRRRTEVLETAMRTAAIQLRVQLAARTRGSRRASGQSAG